MQHLPLQVRLVDHIKVHDAERAHAGGREIERCRGAQSPGADQQHARGLELALSLDAHVGEDQVARVAQDLLVRQLGQLVRHGRPPRVPPAPRARPPPGAARDARDDRNRVAGLHRCLALGELSDVAIIHIHVDEATQPAIVRKQMALEPGVLPGEPFQQLTYAPPLELERVAPVDVGA